jgi:hypothetical protein
VAAIGGTIYLGIKAYQNWQEDKKKQAEDAKKEEKPKKRSSAGKMQQEVERGQAPKEVKRVDKGRGPFEKDHIHFGDEEKSPALNNDGSWKHNPREIPRAVQEWLTGHGWDLPND